MEPIGISARRTAVIWRRFGSARRARWDLPITIFYGDVLRTGLTEFTLLPISLEEQNNNLAMRKSDTKMMSIGTMAALTVSDFDDAAAVAGTGHRSSADILSALAD